MIKNFFNSKKSCYVIAEIGVNHNGDINLAQQLIQSAKDSGADAVLGALSIVPGTVVSSYSVANRVLRLVQAVQALR